MWCAWTCYDISTSSGFPRMVQFIWNIESERSNDCHCLTVSWGDRLQTSELMKEIFNRVKLNCFWKKTRLWIEQVAKEQHLKPAGLSHLAVFSGKLESRDRRVDLPSCMDHNYRLHQYWSLQDTPSLQHHRITDFRWTKDNHCSMNEPFGSDIKTEKRVVAKGPQNISQGTSLYRWIWINADLP